MTGINMQNYNATVRLDGNILHEVPKQNITAPEIIILRYTHGDDAVVHIKKVSGKGKNNKLNQKQEIERLKMIYGDKKFTDVYGGGYINKLPETLDDYTEPEIDVNEVDDIDKKDLDKISNKSESEKNKDELKKMQDKLLAD